MPKKAGAWVRPGWAKTNGAGARVRAEVLLKTGAGAPNGGGRGNSCLWVAILGLTAGAAAVACCSSGPPFGFGLPRCALWQVVHVLNTRWLRSNSRADNSCW